MNPGSVELNSQVPLQAKCPFIAGRSTVEIVDEVKSSNWTRIIYVGASPNEDGGNSYVVVSMKELDEVQLKRNRDAYYNDVL